MLTSIAISASLLAGAPPSAPLPSHEPVVHSGEEVQVILDRLTAQFAELPGVQVKATHRITAPNKTILHAAVRDITIVKPNRISVSQDGVPLIVSNGTEAWTIPTKGTEYEEHAAPDNLSGCIKKFRQLGNGGIAGSGGLVAALLSNDPKKSLFADVDMVSSLQKGDDDLLILRIGPNSETLRPGLRLGMFVPRTGAAWPAQLDVIPPNANVYTRIAFEGWTPTNGEGLSFAKPETPVDRGVFVPNATPGPENKNTDQSPSVPVAPEPNSAPE